MASKWSIFVVLVLITRVRGQEDYDLPLPANNYTGADIDRLSYDLLGIYNTRTAPVEPLTVDFDISPIKVIKVDVENALLTVDLWLKYSWEDNRLVWGPDHFNGVEKLVFKENMIFVPKMELYYGHMTPLLSDQDVVVLHDGSVYLVQPVRAEVYCDLPELPFRKTICNVTIGPWVHDTRQIVLSPAGKRQSDVPRRYQTMGQCGIGRSHVQTVEGHFACCPHAYATTTLSLRLGCKTDTEPAKTAEALQSKALIPEIGSDSSGCLPVVLAPFFVLMIFLMPPKSSDRVLVGAIVFLLLLMIWASGRATDEQESFIQLAVSVTVAATFVSLVSCRLAAPSQGNEGSKTTQVSQYKTRLSTILDLVMFASVTVVLLLAAVGTFSSKDASD